MTALATPKPPVRAIYEEAITRLLDGDMKDEKNTNGWTYVEELARQMLLDPKTATKLIVKASTRGCLPGVKASVKRAVALNGPKLALLDVGRLPPTGQGRAGVLSRLASPPFPAVLDRGEPGEPAA
jgi:hypothetical protein